MDMVVSNSFLWRSINYAHGQIWAEGKEKLSWIFKLLLNPDWPSSFKPLFDWPDRTCQIVIRTVSIKSLNPSGDFCTKSTFVSDIVSLIHADSSLTSVGCQDVQWLIVMYLDRIIFMFHFIPVLENSMISRILSTIFLINQIFILHKKWDIFKK